jgi:hypothetical protein
VGDQADFTSLLRALMSQALRTNKDLARLTGLSIYTIENWTGGKIQRPRFATDVLKIARALALDTQATSALLAAAGHPPLAALHTQAQQTADQDLAALLATWAHANTFDAASRAPARLSIAAAPFIVGPPIRQPQHFFGRTFELTRIFWLWRQIPLQHIAIVGARRSGKTSLLHYLSAITTANPAQLRPGQRSDWLPHPQHYRWVFVDFQDARMRRRERLLRHLLDGLGLPAPEPCELEQFMDIVSRHLRGPALILFDELGAGLAAPELDLLFWESLRSLASHHTDGQLGFVLAAHEDPAGLALAQRKTSPFFNIFGHTFTLGPLTDAEARALIASAPLPFDTMDVEWIIEQSGRWPCLLQILCHARLVALHEDASSSDWQQQGLRQLAPVRHLLETR